MSIQPDIVIIGTGHRLQAGDPEYSIEQRQRFHELLKRTCDKYRIKLIAEEMCIEVLPDFGTTETIGRQVATIQRIKHQYVDLTPQERSHFGIHRVSLDETRRLAKLSEPQFAALERFAGELRECVWLTRVLTINTWPTLFICGASHGPRVEHLFNCVGKLATLEVNDHVP